jgi:hypothetical protein
VGEEKGCEGKRGEKIFKKDLTGRRAFVILVIVDIVQVLKF